MLSRSQVDDHSQCSASFTQCSVRINIRHTVRQEKWFNMTARVEMYVRKDLYVICTRKCSTFDLIKYREYLTSVSRYIKLASFFYIKLFSTINKSDKWDTIIYTAVKINQLLKYSFKIIKSDTGIDLKCQFTFSIYIVAVWPKPYISVFCHF